jgi:predicted RNA-binding Zn-ribbon protein involved in translation (DUF1610 family)
MKIGECTNCFQEKEFYRGRRCKECINERERRRFKENHFKKDLSYVECSNSECNYIYKFITRKSLSKTASAKTHPKYSIRTKLTMDDIIYINGILYVKHNCPKCGNEPLTRKEYKKKDNEIKEVVRKILTNDFDNVPLWKKYKELTGKKFTGVQLSI